MKRLRKQAFGKTLYHGTNYKGLLGIIEAGGLYPNEGNGAGAAGAPDVLFDGFTFLGTSKDVGEKYASWARDSYGEPKVVLEVDVSEDALQPDDNDSRDAKTWQESSDSTGQVKVLGAITSDYIKKVYLYNAFTMDEVLETTLSKAVTDYEANIDKFKDPDAEPIKEEDEVDPNFDPNADFIAALQTTGYTFGEDYTIVNQPIQKYFEILAEYNKPNWNIGSFENENVKIYIKGTDFTESGQIDITYNFEHNEIDIYVKTVETFISEHCKQFPGILENMATVFGEECLCLFDDASEIQFSAVKTLYQNAEQKVAKRLIKKRVII